MKYVDFRKFTDEHGAQPIYLLEGEELYFREKGEALLRSRYVQEPILDSAVLDGGLLKGDKITQLLAAVNTFPFVSEKRFVKVTEFYPTQNDFEKYLQPYFENPTSSTILFIANSEKGKTGTMSLSKAKNVTYVDCGKSDEETIKRWIYLTMKKSGVVADGMTCDLIAAYCNYDMSRISMETEKLLLCAQSAGVTRLTDEMVQENVHPETEYKVYELTNAISRGNNAEFIRILQELTVKTTDILPVLSMIAGYFKTLYEVRVMNGASAAIAAELGMKEFVVRKNKEQSTKFSPEALLRYYTGVYDAIAAVKCGELTPTAAVKWVTAQVFFKQA
ncbi:MAG: DNA polymerase III subunit delta [Clostridiales bacterium]|nr:DNA polymerase III subunit delta [Clostridiales bacterium]